MRLGYWIKSSLRNTAIIVVASLAFGVYYELISSDAEISFSERSGVFLALFSSMLVMIFTVSAYKLDVPLSVAFGSTRREAFVGLQLFRVIPTVICLALGIVMTALGGVEKGVELFAQFLPLAIGASFLYHTFGVIIGIVFHRFGKGVGVLVAFVLGLLVSMSVFAFMVAEALPVLTGWTAALLPILGAILYAAVLPFEWHTLKTLQVKL